MYMIEVLNGEHWELIAEYFESEADAEIYYRCQVPEADGYRIVVAEEV